MAFMGSGEKGRAAINIKSRESNNYYGGKSGSKAPRLPSVVKSVRHNAQAKGGITRATRSY